MPFICFKDSALAGGQDGRNLRNHTNSPTDFAVRTAQHEQGEKKNILFQQLSTWEATNTVVAHNVVEFALVLIEGAYRLV